MFQGYPWMFPANKTSSLSSISSKQSPRTSLSPRTSPRTSLSPRTSPRTSLFPSFQKDPLRRNKFFMKKNKVRFCSAFGCTNKWGNPETLSQKSPKTKTCDKNGLTVSNEKEKDVLLVSCQKMLF